jgi:hypothetical protein
MYLLLLVFGAVLGIAGVVLAGSAISLHDGILDTTILTPGIFLAVGGAVLIGLGAGLRTLRRIERALTARTMAGGLPLPEAKPTEVDDAAQEKSRIPSALNLARRSRESGDTGEKLAEPAAVAEKKSSPEQAAAIAPANDGEAALETLPVGKGNGAAAGRTAPQFPVNLRSAVPMEREKKPAFDALWPKGPRPGRAVQPASTRGITGTTAVEAQKTVEETNDPTRPAVLEGAAAEVSVLKSGIVNGMQYTLYSDGSIEAQLPEGTLRFGSITELRQHIEQSA